MATKEVERKARTLLLKESFAKTISRSFSKRELALGQQYGVSDLWDRPAHPISNPSKGNVVFLFTSAKNSEGN